jgi:hypothetical protein
MAWLQNFVDENQLLMIEAQSKSGTGGAAYSRLCGIDVVTDRFRAIHFSLTR